MPTELWILIGFCTGLIFGIFIGWELAKVFIRKEEREADRTDLLAHIANNTAAIANAFAEDDKEEPKKMGFNK